MASSAPVALRKPAYSAPALEKGLDILELLAEAREPLSVRAIAQALGRSKSEIFRMVFVLVERGYLRRDPASDLLSLSDRLFELGMRTPRSRELVEVAMPVMEQLSDRLGQSVHLVVVNRGETVVVAAAAGRAEVNVTLRLGYRRPAVSASSGRAIIAFQPEATRRRMIVESSALLQRAPEPAALDEDLARIAEAGFVVADSHDVIGVTDLCAPILDRHGRAIASVVVPTLRKRDAEARVDEALTALVEACRAIGSALL